MIEEINKTHWVPTDNRFVCFLDIMGFKDMVMRNTHKDIYDLLLNFSKHRDTLEDVNGLPSTYDLDSLKTMSFSDSIIIFTKTDSVQCFELLTLAVSWLFAKAIESKIAMKGSIALGVTSINISRQIFFGQSIIDSYLLEEDVAFYGIVLHHTVEEFISNNELNPDVLANFKECKAPLKSGKISHLILDWTCSIENAEGKSKEKAGLMLNALRNRTSGGPRKYIDNTLDVINEIYSIPQNI